MTRAELEAEFMDAFTAAAQSDAAFAKDVEGKMRDALISLGWTPPEQFGDLKARMSDLVDHFEGKRDSAKAAATHYPSKAATVLGEADAYDDVAAELRDFIASLKR